MILDGYRGTWETQETDDLRDLVRTFMNKEIVPNQHQFIDDHQVPRELWNRAGEAGLLCISIPEEYGGGGGTFAHEAIILQEQGFAGDAAWGNAVHSTIIAHYINAFGTEAQKKQWLPRMATGELVAAIAMTEPGTGSDLQNVKTKAVRDGDEYVINGSKTFISNGTHADLVVIVARTSEDAGAKGVSLIVAEVADLPGFSRGRVLDKVGQRGQDTRELFFEDMRVPVDNVLGGVEGRGFIQLMQQLPQERMALAVAGATMAEAAVREATAYAKDREAFGQPIIKFQNTKFVLAECATEAFSTRTFVDHLTQLHIDGTLTTEQASAGKYWATDAQTNVIDRCLQIFGGYGYMLEYPIARMYADARVQKIYAGTNEIMKELIARGL